MAKKSVHVSVVIPTYNRANLVTRAIDSVLAQTYKDYEIIVVDDGSTDNTRELLRERYAGRIRYIRRANAGVSAARNMGVQASRSELVAFLDSDDIWMPRKLEVQLPVMSDPTVILSYTNCVYDTHPDKDFFSTVGLSFGPGPVIVSDPTTIVSRVKGTGIALSSIICRKSALLRVGGFDERMSVYEDTRIQFRLAMEGKFAVVSEPLLVWSTSESVERLSKPTYSFFKESADLGVEVFWEFYARAINSPPDVQKRLRRNLAYNLSLQSEYLALEGRYRTARRKAFESLVFAPTSKSALRALVGLALPRAFHLLSKHGKSALGREAGRFTGE